MNSLDKINFKSLPATEEEKKYLLSKELLSSRVHKVYGTSNVALPLIPAACPVQEPSDLKINKQPTQVTLPSGDIEKGTFSHGQLHGDHCTRIFKNVSKGTYTGKFIFGECRSGKRTYYPDAFGNQSQCNWIQEVGNFDSEGLLHGSQGQLISFYASSINDPSPKKLWEYIGTFEHGEMREGVKKLYCFLDGIHTLEGTFKKHVLDGNNCKNITPTKWELGRFKEGKLIFGSRITRSETECQQTMTEEGNFDPETGNLHGKHCTISTAKWSLEGETIQGRIQNGRLTIRTQNMRLDEQDKEALQNLGFLGFPSSSWWERLSF